VYTKFLDAKPSRAQTAGVIYFRVSVCDGPGEFGAQSEKDRLDESRATIDEAYNRDGLFVEHSELRTRSDLG
jgi:hypothetical protein